MNTYSIALFIHIAGALGFFTTFALEWITLRQMRRAATVQQLRTLVGLTNGSHMMGGISLLAILAAGIYMMLTAWGFEPWIYVTLGTLVLLVILGMALTGPRMAAISQLLLESEGPLSARLQGLVRHPLLWVSIQIRIAVTLGIFFLMSVKPDLTGSLLTIGVAALLGLLFSLPTFRRQPAQEMASG